MRVISLGSGSSGNALVVTAGSVAVLIDAGFSSRTLLSRLRQVGIAPNSLGAICLTHEHDDHTNGATRLAAQLGIPLLGDERTLAAVCQRSRPRHPQADAVERTPLPLGRTTRIGTLDITSFPTSHDAVAPCGYLLSSSAWRVAFATDTGMATSPMLDALRRAHLIVLEANHDRMRLLDGPYPHHLKHRILSPTGHLSNEQTCEALSYALAEDDGPRWVWLAHLSKTNNTPDLARAAVTDHLRRMGRGHIQPVPLPREVGPVWDSATLWADGSTPVQAALPLAPATAPAARSVPRAR